MKCNRVQRSWLIIHSDFFNYECSPYNAVSIWILAVGIVFLIGFRFSADAGTLMDGGVISNQVSEETRKPAGDDNNGYFTGAESEKQKDSGLNSDGGRWKPVIGLTAGAALWTRESKGIAERSGFFSVRFRLPLAWWLTIGAEGGLTGIHPDSLNVEYFEGTVSFYSGRLGRRGYLSNPDGLLWRPGLDFSYGARYFDNEMGKIFKVDTFVPVRTDMTVSVVWRGRELPIASYTVGLSMKIYSRFSAAEEDDLKKSNPDGRIGGLEMSVEGFLIRDPDFEPLGEGMMLEVVAPLSTHLSINGIYSADKYDFSFTGLGARWYF